MKAQGDSMEVVAKPRARRARRVKAGTSKSAAALRREAFARAYIANNRNGTQAAITAGFSPKGADVTASQLLREPRVQQLIAELAAPAIAAAGIELQNTIDHIRRVNQFDIGKLYDHDGNLKPVHLLDEDTRLALSHIGPHGPVPNDRLKALDMSMKYLGAYEKDNDQARFEPVHINLIFE